MVAQVTMCRLQMHRDRIMYSRLNAGCQELTLHFCTVPRAHYVQVINMPVMRQFTWQLQLACIQQQLSIRACMRTPQFRPPLKVAQLDAQNGSLNAFQPGIEPSELMMVLLT